MKVVVFGTRDITSYQIVEKAIQEGLTALQLDKSKITELVSGGCRGVDTIAETWAVKNGVKVVRFPADWNRYGLSAGPIRNREMGNYCDVGVSIWDGKSRGTKNMIDFLKEKKKPVHIYFAQIG